MDILIFLKEQLLQISHFHHGLILHVEQLLCYLQYQQDRVGRRAAERQHGKSEQTEEDRRDGERGGGELKH